jgi:hypothetical protein
MAVGMPPLVAGTLFRRVGSMLGSGAMSEDGLFLLRYGRGCDNHRLREEVGYELAFDSEGTARDFAASRHGMSVLFPSPHPGSPVRSLGR